MNIFGQGPGTRNVVVAAYGDVVVVSNTHDSRTASFTLDGIGDPNALYAYEHQVFW